MPNLPLAYHLTFGTYGGRLHGDPRGSVDRQHNQPGEATLGEDLRRVQREATCLRAGPVMLSVEQRLFVEATVPLICARGGWGYHVASAGPDHVHVLVSGAVEGTKLRRLLKRWLGQELSSRWSLEPPSSDARPDGCRWWAEGGSGKWVWRQDYFRRAFDYIAAQRTTEFGPNPGLHP